MLCSNAIFYNLNLLTLKQRRQLFLIKVLSPFVIE